MTKYTCFSRCPPAASLCC
ncbi:truncated Cy13.1 [Cynomolgus cytomegalovirus]|nr:truncated Cy13.1 [Cynomolgus cytomegalovirus]